MRFFGLAGWLQKWEKGRMHNFNLFEQVDGKAGRKGICCNLEGSKGLIGLEGGQVSAGLDGEAFLRSWGRIRLFIKDKQLTKYWVTIVYLPKGWRV